MLLLRAHKGLPKYAPLIKFLSEPGMKQLLQKAENFYMQDNEREMPVVTDPLFFVINEHLHSVDMTDKGHDVLANAVGNDNFFVLPDVGAQTAEIEHSELSPPREAAEEGRADGRILHQERACPHGQPAAEGLHHVREGRGLRDHGRQGQDRRRVHRPYHGRDAAGATDCTRLSRPRRT